MNRNLTIKNKVSHKVIGFWSMIVLLTLVFIGFVIVKFVEKQQEQTMEDIINLTENYIFEQEGTYYVYIYSISGVTKDDDELEEASSELKEVITTYLTYAKRNKEANKLYGMNVDQGTKHFGNQSRLIISNNDTQLVNVTNFDLLKISQKDVPMLIKIANGKIEQQFLTETKIREELEIGMKVE